MKNMADKIADALPTFSSYGEYSSKAYGAHCLVFSIGKMDIYFSYQTCVAFRAPEAGLVVMQNHWGPTTGKHLKWIDGCTTRTGKHRLEGEEFDKRLFNSMITNGLLKGKRILTEKDQLDDLPKREAKTPDNQAGVPLLNPDKLIKVDDPELI